MTLIAAVPAVQVETIQSDPPFVVTPTLMKGVSHLLSYWIKEQPLGHVLTSIIDGGGLLHDDFWHPLRPPMFHVPAAVAHLNANLKRGWADVSDKSEDRDGWLTSEMTRLLAVMNHAAETSECIVTALDYPGDHDRAKRVRIPWMPPTAEHGAPKRKWWKLW